MSQTHNPTVLGEEKINRLMLKFSIPCVLSLLVSSLYNLVDQIFTVSCEAGGAIEKNTDLVEDNAVTVMRFESGAIAINETGFVSDCSPKAIDFQMFM